MAFVFGDWHGSRWFAGLALDPRNCPDGHDLVHVGDFGLYPGTAGTRYLDHVQGLLGDRILRVVPGNHEYWPGLPHNGTVLDESDPFGLDGRLDEAGFLISSKWPGIRICDRTAVWHSEGLLWAALSGANSIDFQLRTPGLEWWPEESPTADHVRELVAQVEAARLTDRLGPRLDVLVTHDAPTSAIAALGLYPPARNRVDGWSAQAIAYAEASAEVVDLAHRELRPRIHVCGHHHVRRTCRLVSPEGIISDVELLDREGSIADNRLHIPRR